MNAELWTKSQLQLLFYDTRRTTGHIKNIDGINRQHLTKILFGGKGQCGQKMEGQCFWTIESSNTIFAKVQGLWYEGDITFCYNYISSPLLFWSGLMEAGKLRQDEPVHWFFNFHCLLKYIKTRRLKEKVSEQGPECLSCTTALQSHRPPSAGSDLNHWPKQSGNQRPSAWNRKLREKYRFSKQSFLL